MSFKRISPEWTGILGLLFILLMIGCSGPDTRDDADPTAVATESSSSPVAESPSTPAASPTVAATPTEEPTVEASPTQSNTPTTVSASPEPTRAASPSLASSPTVVVEPRDILPAITEVPGDGYIVAEEGSRTAQDLANAYADPAAHLQRLNEWGFRRHAYRAFSRDATGDGDPLPTTILATVNEYGSVEQADDAIEWLSRLARTQGATEADGVATGDRVEAFTIATASGYPTASIYVRAGETILVYYAEGGDPLPALVQIATAVSRR